MDGQRKDVVIAIPPVVDTVVSSGPGDDERPSYRRGDTFGPSGMPITIQVSPCSAAAESVGALL